MYLVMFFIFYFILISVLYIHLYIYLYLYIYSILIIFIIIYFVVLYHSILINIYINVSDVDFTFFWISKSINPRLSVLRLPSISNYFYKISDWFPKTFINENTMQQPIKPHISMFFSEISTLKSFPNKEIFYYTLKEIISHNRILAPVEALSNNFRKDSLLLWLGFTSCASDRISSVPNDILFENLSLSECYQQNQGELI